MCKLQTQGGLRKKLQHPQKSLEKSMGLYIILEGVPPLTLPRGVERPF